MLLLLTRNNSLESGARKHFVKAWSCLRMSEKRLGRHYDQRFPKWQCNLASQNMKVVSWRCAVGDLDKSNRGKSINSCIILKKQWKLTIQLMSCSWRMATSSLGVGITSGSSEHICKNLIQIMYSKIKLLQLMFYLIIEC